MKHKILLVEDDKPLREALADTIKLANFNCVKVDCAESAIVALKKHKDVDLIVSDIQMSGIGGMGLLKFVKNNYPDIPFLLITAFATIDKAVEAIKLGAVDYLAKPFAPEVLVNNLTRYISVSYKENDLVIEDPKSIKIYNLAKKVALSDASVLIEGPSGSGKEVLAHYIHRNSSRAKEPFVAINCAAIPDNMLEATLFGYEKGAYTGAHQACPGKFEQAQEGTLLLDEISEMNLSLQAKILRVLQEKEVERLGSRKMIKLNVRIIATTNRSLREYVKEKRFREDLYFRLNVFPMFLPNLNERKQDILPLCNYFLAKYSNKLVSLSDCAKEILKSYSWIGNVRELENVIQRSLILAGNSPEITADHIILHVKDCAYEELDI